MPCSADLVELMVGLLCPEVIFGTVFLTGTVSARLSASEYLNLFSQSVISKFVQYMQTFGVL